MLPLLTQVLVTTSILNFLGVWNDFLLPLYYLDNIANWPITLAVYNFLGSTSRVGTGCLPTYYSPLCP